MYQLGAVFNYITGYTSLTLSETESQFISFDNAETREAAVDDGNNDENAIVKFIIAVSLFKVQQNELEIIE